MTREQLIEKMLYYIITSYTTTSSLFVENRPGNHQFFYATVSQNTNKYEKIKLNHYHFNRGDDCGVGTRASPL